MSEEMKTPTLTGSLQNIIESFSSGGGSSNYHAYLHHSKISPEKINELLEALKDDENEGRQLAGIDELCNHLSIGTEATVSALRVEKFIPELVKLLQKNHNIDLMLLSARALAHMMDCMPSSASYVVSSGAIPVFLEKLTNIDCIDVAEQCIPAVAHLADHYGPSLLKEGVVGACLLFMDFFSISIQRQIVQIVSSSCRRLNSSHFDLVDGILEKLSELLQYHDHKIIELSASSLARIAACFASDPAKTEKIFTRYNIIRTLVNLLTSYETLGRQTFSYVMSTLTTTARICPSIMKMLHQQRVSNTLGLIMSGEKSKLASKGSSNTAPQEQQFQDAVALATELLPRLDLSNQFVAEMNYNRRKDLLQKLVTPAEYLQKVASPYFKQDMITKQEIFAKNPEFLLSYGEVLLPVLIKLYSSGHNATIKSKCLTLIGSLVFYSSSEVLREMLREISFSTFLASVLASDDLVDVATGIQIAELLMQKLPDIFSVYFVREGVANQLQKISGRKPGDQEPTMLEQMRDKVKQAYQKAEEEKKEKEEKLRKETEEAAAKQQEPEQEKTPQQEESSNAEEEQNEENNEEGENEEGEGEKVEALSSKPIPPKIVTKAIQLVHPVVQPPKIPADSKFAKHSSEKDMYKSPELAEYVVALAQEVQRKFFDEDLKSSKFASPVVANLRALGEELVEYVENSYPLKEGMTLKKIREVLTSEEGVSNFEILNSGIFKALLTYLTKNNEKDPSERLLRFSKFCEVFNEAVEEQKVGFGQTPGSPLASSPLSSSPLRSKFMTSQPQKHTYMVDLIRKLQACFSTTENLPLLVNEGQTNILGGIQNLVNMLSKSIRLEIRPAASEPLGKPTLTVSMPPLESLETLAKFAVTKIAEKEKQLAEEKKKKELEQEAKKTEEIPAATTVAEETKTEQPSTSTENNNNNEENEENGEEEEEPQSNEQVGSSSATNYFEVQEENEEEDFNVSNAQVIQIPKSKAEEKSKYSFLDEQAAQKSSSTPSASTEEKKPEVTYQFFLNGHALDNKLSIFLTLYKYGKRNESQPRHPYYCKFWDSTKVLEYKVVPAEEASRLQQNASIREWISYGDTQNFLADDAAALSRLIDRSVIDTLDGIDRDAVEILELIRLLFIASTNASKLPHIRNSSKMEQKQRLVAGREFRNAKITAKLIRQLHDPYVVFTACMPQWCVHLVTTCPFLFSYATRKEFFDLTSMGIARAIKRMQDEHLQGTRNRHERVIRIEKQKATISRERLLEDAFYVIDHYGAVRQTLEFEYEGEVGTGLGPTLEFYTLVSKELQVRALDAWRDETSTGEQDLTATVTAPNGLFPRPISASKNSSKEERIFTFAGLFVARALFDGRLLDMPFSTAFLKAIRGDVLYFKDLETVDRKLYIQLEKLRVVCEKRRKIFSDNKLSENEKNKALQALTIDGKARVEDVMLDFTLPGYPEIELVPGGAQKDVTLDNLEEYILAVTKYTLEEGVHRQIKAFRDGFNLLIPVKTLKLFTLQELEDMMCGCDEKWTEQLLLESTNCDHGYTHSSKAVKYLFKILTDMSTQEQRSFLKFVTGSPKLPVGGIRNLRPKLTVVRKPNDKSSPDEYLPSVMTCTNYLKLPDYSSVEVMKKQLFKAIEEGQGAFLLS